MRPFTTRLFTIIIVACLLFSGLASVNGLDEVRPASLPVKIGNEGAVVVIPRQAVAAVEI